MTLRSFFFSALMMGLYSGWLVVHEGGERGPSGAPRSSRVLRLLEPMLARGGAIPTGAGWLFAPKLDGFPCLAGG